MKKVLAVTILLVTSMASAETCKLRPTFPMATGTPFSVACPSGGILGIAIVTPASLLRTSNGHLILFAPPCSQHALRSLSASVIWMFLPGPAALAIPWVFTLWLLRHFGYAGQAVESDEIQSKGWL